MKKYLKMFALTIILTISLTGCILVDPYDYGGSPQNLHYKNHYEGPQLMLIPWWQRKNITNTITVVLIIIIIKFVVIYKKG